MDLREIAAAFDPGSSGVRFRQGEVVSVQADGTATITIAGSATSVAGVRCLSSCCPKVGGGIWLATDGRDIFGIGTIGYGPASFSIARVAVYSINTTTYTIINFGAATPDFDTHGFFDTTNHDRFIIGVPGVYALSGDLIWATGTTGIRIGELMVNGGVVAETRVQAASSSTTANNPSAIVKLALNDYVQLRVYHSQGADLDVSATAYSPRLSGAWIGPA